jgi:hypothetical protein
MFTNYFIIMHTYRVRARKRRQSKAIIAVLLCIYNFYYK